MTCEYSIANSANVQCTGGSYLYPEMTIVNHCKENYYTTGRKETTCHQKKSSCSPCNCNSANSNGNECSDQSGQCNCKHRFKGIKCNDRDCVWGTWSLYSDTPCSRACDYGGSKTITRSHQITKQGNGRQCYGPSTQSKSCFNGCCSGQYHCTNTKNCIPSSDKCNYDNNCGDHQDESSCSEHCYVVGGSWEDDGGGNLVYLDRLNLKCGHWGKVLKMFHLERNGGRIRYKYKCCNLNKRICINVRKYNRFTLDGGGNSVYLDRQAVSCGNHAFLNGFWLRRNHALNRIRYEYLCCNLREERHRRRTHCEEKRTGYTYHDDKGSSVYLDRQKVECQGRSFLSSFALERDHSSGKHWRYRYTCCEVRS